MRQVRLSCPLWVAVFVSVLLHLGIAGVAGVRLLRSEQAALSVVALEAHRARKPVTLGIERSAAVTMTWLGFEEPTPHEAPKSEIEQAAFSLREARRAVAQAAQEARQAAAEAAAGAFAVRAAIERAVRTMPIPATTQADASGEQTEAGGAEAPSEEAASESSVGEPGKASEKESDATSLREPVSVRLGQPAAAEGLEIRTRRPSVSIVSRLAGSARQPEVGITFGRSGRVIRADYLSGKGTGNAELDSGLLASIFGWTAKGEALDELDENDPDAGVTIVMRLLF